MITIKFLTMQWEVVDGNGRWQESLTNLIFVIGYHRMSSMMLRMGFYTKVFNIHQNLSTFVLSNIYVMLLPSLTNIRTSQAKNSDCLLLPSLHLYQQISIQILRTKNL